MLIRAAREAVNYARHVRDVDRAKCNTVLAPLSFDQGFKSKGASRAVANDLKINI